MLIASTLQRLDDSVDYLFKRNTYELFEGSDNRYKKEDRLYGTLSDTEFLTWTPTKLEVEDRKLCCNFRNFN